VTVSSARQADDTERQARALLEIDGLTIDHVGSPEQRGLVHDIRLSIAAGQTAALVGESGCGKTMTAMAILGLLPTAMRVSAGSIMFDGVDLVTSSRRVLRRLRGKEISVVFQDPMSSLNPTMSLGDQIAEARRLHLGESWRAARRHAVRLLDTVGIDSPAQRARAYPHELSGGMQQRAMIAAAISCDPRLIVADEPTTALDVTVQADILDLLRDLQRDREMAVLLVTHDLGVVADFCSTIAVMYAGQIVDRGPVEEVLTSPLHPYTEALLSALPRLGRSRTYLDVIPGRVPPAGSFPTGCRFEPRCRHAVDSICRKPQPEIELETDRTSRCVRVASHGLTLKGIS
jgi:oligopeptide/dipeptide ABC transporter ATP-binding protein